MKTLASLNAPRWTDNLYFFRPGGNAVERMYRRNRILDEVHDWLKDVNKRYKLGLTIRRGNYTVRGIKNDEVVAYYYIDLSRNHAFKNQDFRPLVRLIDNVMKERIKKRKQTLQLKNTGRE